MKRARLFPVALLAAVLLTTACSRTIIPAPVEAKQASFDRGDQTSGVVAIVDSADALRGWVITERARARYNILVEQYGARMWIPSIGPDYGVTPYSEDCFFMTDEAMSKFVAMAELARMEGR